MTHAIQIAVLGMNRRNVVPCPPEMKKLCAVRVLFYTLQYTLQMLLTIHTHWAGLLYCW